MKITTLEEAYQQVMQLQLEPQTDVPSHSNQDEGCSAHEMAHSQLGSILHNAQSLSEMIDSVSDIEPWVAEKITLANDYLNTVQEWVAHQASDKNCENQSTAPEVALFSIPS